MICIRLFISGKVQGVNFRYHARQKALELSVAGWVRNTGDGEVEIVAEGGEMKVREFVEWCKKGPARARVQEVRVQEEKYNGYFRTFGVKYDSSG